MEPFKNAFNKTFITLLSDLLVEIKTDFDKGSFTNNVFDNTWESKELKDRMKHISIVMIEHLSDNYKENVASVIGLIDLIHQKKIKSSGIEFMFLPDFIEIYGIDDYETSMYAMEHITQFTTCEFAIRPFLIKYPEKGIKQMVKWSKHKHPMVRRLSTEGARPRLPWGMALPFLKQDPSPILGILETLKNDSSESVRRSVANNLNDIAKDNPNTVIDIAKNWFGDSSDINWVVKHGCRTLLKQGNTEVLDIFGLGFNENIILSNFKVNTPKVKIGDAVEFSFNLNNTDNKPLIIRLEYGIHYQKANGKLAKKVFKISEKEYASQSEIIVTRKQSFKIITTRKFHLGKHGVSIIINGKEFNTLPFELIN